MDERHTKCPVCSSVTSLLDVVDFNKSCEELRGRFLPLSGHPVYYALCDRCGFCFAPELHGWTPRQFAERIYNAGYSEVDPDHLELRPRANVELLRSMFPHLPGVVRHLDYGSGNGLLTRLLRESGWDSYAHDPFLDQSSGRAPAGRFNLISAFEVFEHVADVHTLMVGLRALLSADGVILLSTLLSDQHIGRGRRLDWWYASPRNGHISLFSRNALAGLSRSYGFNLGSFSANLHVLFTTVPTWARQGIRATADLARSGPLARRIVNFVDG